EAIESYESAVQADPAVDVRGFLPAAANLDDSGIALELFCVDLNYRFGRADCRSLDDYRRDFPEWLSRNETFSELAKEEYRLRLSRDEQVTPAEYARRYGLDTRTWPATEPTETTHSTVAEGSRLLGLQSELQRLTDAITELPAIGDEVADCEILDTLGSGAFGVVYLARQMDLAARHVVLKVTASRNHEPAQLARLQHTNIVPIYSVHCDDLWQTICMPYFGRTTLEEVLRGRSDLPTTFTSRSANSPQMTHHSSGAASSHPLPEAVVLAIAQQLAAALQHGHERGIIHRDLKPANILLSDDGVAMLLDYNLSASSISGGQICWQVGGTLPYMAPEHLESIRSGDAVGPTADVYSLGVVCYQMLTGQLPFPARRGPFDETLAQCLDDRRRLRPTITDQHPNVSSALESIVQRMLAPEIGDRYATMAEVLEDLSRQAANRPLRFAPNVFWRERVAKWARRHPRLSSAFTVAAIASALLLMLAIALVANQRRVAQQNAVAAARDLRDALPTIRVALSLPGEDATTRQTGRDLAQQFLAHHTDETASQSLRTASLTGLSMAEANELKANLAECATLLQATNEAVRNASAQEESNKLGERLLAALMADAPVRALAERRINAVQALQRQDYSIAAAELESLRDENPHDISLWLLLGNAYAGQQQWSDAESCYTVCITHWPTSHVGYFYRGLARLDQKNYAGARDDFSAVLERRNNLSAALINRAVANRQLQAWPEALTDLNAAIALDDSQPRLYLMRSEILGRLRRGAEARQDRATALKMTPRDARNWVELGLAQLPADPAAAQQAFERARELDPSSWEAARNLALVHAEIQHEPTQAIAILDQLIGTAGARCADYVSRAVLRARLGERDMALADAAQAGKLSPTDKEVFQLACVYALTSKQVPDDIVTAVALIDEALTRNPAWLNIARRDPDLKALQGSPDFQQVLQHAEQRAKLRKSSDNLLSPQ
ncbi:MAG: protein kinase, partial [Planctomycetales bacterium]|nr:protein kinase [Planctomycetales bacterium]